MPNWLLLLPTGWLLAAIALGGAVATLAVTLYPAASAREDKARLAKDARSILSPEIEANKKLAYAIQTEVTPNTIPKDILETAAWQTVSAGGLLVGLEPSQITRLLRVYSLVFQVNALLARMLDLTTGMSYALTQSPQLRRIIWNELQPKLLELQKALAEIDTANTVAPPNVVRDRSQPGASNKSP